MLRFRAEDFCARLPWFYHGMPFDHPQEHDIVSFEVNGLQVEPAVCDVALVVGGTADSIEVSFDGLSFERVPVEEGVVRLRGTDLSRRMLSFFVRGAEPGEVIIHRPDVPLEKVLADAPLFEGYVRDIGADRSEALGRWDEFWAIAGRPPACAPKRRRRRVNRHAFDGMGGAQDPTLQALRGMFAALLDWCARRQVLDAADPHFGAVYSEEDKYDFRDAAAAVVAFTYAFRDDGKARWLQRARLARRYVYLGQHTAGERSGGWAHMVSGKWGGDLQTQYTRITQQRPGVDGVDTCIIIDLLCRAIELGLEPDAEDLRRIELGGEWVARHEIAPGVFAHHEGATHDCQNSNALGAMALSRAHQTLTAAGLEPPDEWVAGARRGLAHWLEGQEAIGVWPYLFAGIGRGQAFGYPNVPDMGMGGYHFLVACDTPALRDMPGADQAAMRAARWYLGTCRIDEGEPGPTIDLEYQRDGGGLLFSSFTWCRFMAAAVLARTAARTGEVEPWRSLALRLMEHVRAKLWNDTDPNRPPVVRSCRPDIELHSWIAAAEWETVLLRDILEHLGATART